LPGTPDTPGAIPHVPRMDDDNLTARRPLSATTHSIEGA
jgi:cytochrome bd ubiquinol oxidase subunit I